MTRSLIVSGVLAAALTVPAVASASEYDRRDVRTDVINVADLDLSTGWGMDRLIKRLRGRIVAMCDRDDDCRDQAWLSADWQVARELQRDQWRERIAYERASDRRHYRVLHIRRATPSTVNYAPPPAPPRIAYASPPGELVSKTTTTTTQTFTVRTTTVTLTYRLPPPDERATWTRRENCGC